MDDSLTLTEEEVGAPVSQWSEPTPLPHGLQKVEPFSDQLLPESLRPWINDIAERVQCPQDFLGVGAMVAMSSVIGRKVAIQPKQRDDWHEIPNLWGIVVGRPGVMKSPALAEILKPLKQFEKNSFETWQNDHANWKRTQLENALRDDAAKGAAKKALVKDRSADISHLLDGNWNEPEPTLRRYITNDASVEALGELLINNSNGLLAYRDEVYGLLKSMDKEGSEGARAFYLTAWNGKDPYVFDRIGRGLNRRIDAVCLSLLGGIQPARLSEYVRSAVTGNANDDGLLQRFQLLVWPDIGSEWRNVDRFPDSQSKQKAYDVFTRLNDLVTEESPTLWRYSLGGLELFTEWRTTLESRLRQSDLSPALESHLSKYRKLVPALSLICALADGETGNQVSETSTLRALAWSDYLESHAQRLYGVATRPDVTSAKALLKKIKSGEVKEGFSLRDIYRNGWSQLTTPEVAKKAVDLLIDYGWLQEQLNDYSAQGGRPSCSYLIHPHARG